MNSIDITGYVINGPVVEKTKDPNNPKVILDILVTNNSDLSTNAHILCFKYVANHAMKHIHLHDYVYIHGFLSYYGTIVAEKIIVEVIPPKEKVQGINYVGDRRRVVGIEKPNAEYGNGEELEDFDGLVE